MWNVPHLVVFEYCKQIVCVCYYKILQIVISGKGNFQVVPCGGGRGSVVGQ